MDVRAIKKYVFFFFLPAIKRTANFTLDRKKYSTFGIYDGSLKHLIVCPKQWWNRWRHTYMLYNRSGARIENLKKVFLIAIFTPSQSTHEHRGCPPSG